PSRLSFILLRPCAKSRGEGGDCDNQAGLEGWPPRCHTHSLGRCCCCSPEREPASEAAAAVGAGLMSSGLDCSCSQSVRFDSSGPPECRLGRALKNDAKQFCSLLRLRLSPPTKIPPH